SEGQVLLVHYAGATAGSPGLRAQLVRRELLPDEVASGTRRQGLGPGFSGLGAASGNSGSHGEAGEPCRQGLASPGPAAPRGKRPSASLTRARPLAPPAEVRR